MSHPCKKRPSVEVPAHNNHPFVAAVVGALATVVRPRPSAAAGVTVLLSAALLSPGCRSSESDGAAAAPETAPVERRDLEIRAEASGLVEPVRVVEVKSRASGEVLRLHVETGDAVQQGELLVEIDPRDLRNALEQAQADLEVARVRNQTARSQLQRVQELRRANVVTQEEYETTVEAAANARADLVRAETNLELARTRMGDVTIRAPIAGIVIERTVEAGQIIASATSNVSGGTTLLRMADLAEVQVRTLVDETDIGLIAPGQPGSVTVEAYPGRPFTGTVTKIEPQAVVEQNVTMFPVLVRLSNPDGLLKPGMNAEVVIEVARRADAVVVPNGAVVSPREALTAAAAVGLDPEELRASFAAERVGAGGSARGETRSAGDSRRDFPGEVAVRGGSTASRPGLVFVAAASGAEPRRVLLGMNDLDYTEVVSGVKPGERVILVSVARLQQQQEEFSERMRERAGGLFPGSQRSERQGTGGGTGGGGAVAPGAGGGGRR